MLSVVLLETLLLTRMLASDLFFLCAIIDYSSLICWHSVVVSQCLLIDLWLLARLHCIVLVALVVAQLLVSFVCSVFLASIQICM